MTETQSDADAQTYDTINRRTFMIGAGATAAAIATAGVASAQSGTTIDFASEYAQNPTIHGSVEIAEYDLGDMSGLEYINDEGDVDDLAEYGAVLAGREDADEPNNPVRYYATDLESDEYTAFPRGVTEDDGDDEVDVSWLDADQWDTTGSIVVEEGDGLVIRGDGISDTATATFTHEDWEISSGQARKYLQVVANVDALPADALVTVRVKDDEGGSVSATIDPNGDTADDDVIASSTATGVVYQRQLGELGETLETITDLEVEITDADAEIELFGLNLERESRWSFGEREVLNADDEITTETIRQNDGGAIEITSLETIGSPLDSGRLDNVSFAVDLEAAELPASEIIVNTVDAGRLTEGDRDTLVGVVYQFEPPTAYDLSWSLENMTDVVAHPASRYRAAEFAIDVDEFDEYDDVDDEDWTSRTSEYESADLDDEIEITSTLVAGQRTAVHVDLLLTSDEADDVTTAVGGGGAPLDGDGSFWSSPQAVVLGALTGIAAWFAGVRDWILQRGE